MMWITLNFLSENVDIKDFPKMAGYKGIYLSELYIKQKTRQMNADSV